MTGTFLIAALFLHDRTRPIYVKRQEYLLANWTKPHAFPTGIFTETTSPNWEKGCLRSSSLTSESSPPTNICNKSQIKELSRVKDTGNRKKKKELNLQLCYWSHYQTGNLEQQRHLMHVHHQLIPMLIKGNKVIHLLKNRLQNYEYVKIDNCIFNSNVSS